MADLSITASQVLASATAQTRQGVAAVAITAGQVVYKDSTGKYALADANGVSPLFTVAGIALNSAAANQPITICIEDSALVLGAAASMAIGTTYILSATPGGIAPDADGVAGWKKSILGGADTATTLDFKITNTGTAIP